MPSNFTLGKNVQFYRAEQVTTAQIVAVLDAASSSAVSNSYYFDQIRQSDPVAAYTYSARIFKTHRDVYFYNDPTLKDTIHGFIVIIEVDGHLVVLKKQCEDLSLVLDDVFDRLSLSEFSATFSDDQIEFQKLNVRNMTVSERAIRARSYEAWDLKGLLSVHAAGRSIPSYFRVKDRGLTRSFSLGSGRLVEFSDRQSIADIADWARSFLSMLGASPKQNSFLDNFAKIVDLQEVLSKTDPRSILIEASVLKEQLKSGSLKLYLTLRSGRERPLEKNQAQAVFDILDRVYEIDDDERIVGHAPDAWLKSGPKRRTLTFHSRFLSRLKVENDGAERCTLQRHIIKNGLYTICFDDPKYIYFMRKCFSDAAGISELDTILKLFEPRPELLKAASEKGVDLVGMRKFPPTSIFAIVEQIFADDDFVLCDDLGDEWADHITFNIEEGRISFVHSKHKEESLSASALHDVVGQAIKNVGNMHFNASAIIRKYNSKMKSKRYPKSSISRVRARRGQFPPYIPKILANYALSREAVLACSFISLASIKSQFERLKAGKGVRGNIVQFVWIVSSFAHACRDAGVVPRILCKP